MAFVKTFLTLLSEINIITSRINMMTFIKNDKKTAFKDKNSL